MKPWLPLLLLLPAASLAGCAGLGIDAPDPAGYDSGPMRVSDYLEVQGAGRETGRRYEDRMRLALSRDAALSDARGKLASALESLAYAHGVWDLSPIGSLVQSAEVAAAAWDEDGSAMVILRLPVARVDRALGTGIGYDDSQPSAGGAQRVRVVRGVAVPAVRR